MNDTLRRKRYIVVCAGCDLLFEAARADRITCSPACRVRLHRHPEHLAELRRDAVADGITVASILRGAASARLCPALTDACIAGRCSADDVHAATWSAYWALVARAYRLTGEAAHA